MSNRTSWIAVCSYPGKEQFCFYSPVFLSEGWSTLDEEAKATVREAWARISPHEPPEIIDLIPGFLDYVSTQK